jgi:hypothetical protein
LTIEKVGVVGNIEDAVASVVVDARFGIRLRVRPGEPELVVESGEVVPRSVAVAVVRSDLDRIEDVVEVDDRRSRFYGDGDDRVGVSVSH